MITQTGIKVIFRYDTVDRHGIDIPRTRCIIQNPDKEVLASSTVHLKIGKEGDKPDKKEARRFAFEKAMVDQSGNPAIEDKETRKDLWLSFFSKITQPK